MYILRISTAVNQLRSQLC